MFQYLIPAVRATMVLALLTGLVFPFAVTAISQLLFPKTANGSLVYNGARKVIGSTLIGQNFTGAANFHPRPSAVGYAAENSSGTQLGPTSYTLIFGEEKANAYTTGFVGVAQLAKQYRTENMLSAQEKVPVDAVTRSGSGLDPDISIQNAAYQARRVAECKRVPLRAILNLIQQNSEGRQLGLLGEPRVNVLKLNIKLDEAFHS